MFPQSFLMGNLLSGCSAFFLQRGSEEETCHFTGFMQLQIVQNCSEFVLIVKLNMECQRSLTVFVI